jgi:hypothetical protein
VRHILRFIISKLGVAVPQAGAGLLASSVTIASALWVTVTLPNMPVLRAFDGANRTSVSISLQSALLGIDDGNGRSLHDARALARSLGIPDMNKLPTPAELRAFATSPAPSGPVVTQLADLALNASTPATTPATTPQPVSQQHDVAPPAPPAPPASPAPVAPPASTPAARAKPKSPAPVVTLPTAPPQQPAVPTAPTPPTPVATPATPAPVPPADEPPATPVDPAVPDTTPPTLDAHADVTADAAGPAGAAVSYSLPTAMDAVDGVVPVVCAPAPGSSFAFGPTLVSCSAEDAAHNVAQSSFTVTVRDLTGPTVQVPAAAEVDTTSAAGAYVSYSATADDAVDGPVAVTCAPVSGSLFPVGHSSVTCTAEDAAHNVSQASFDVHVLDDTAPPIVQAQADLTVEATGPAGATVTYADPVATDIVDGAVSVACAPASGSVFGVGLTTVTCTAEDASHNTGQSTFEVLVHDTVAPAIQAHADLAAEAAPGGTAVAYSLPSASDAVDGSVSVTCAPASGSLFAAGGTTVTCSAHDAAGNSSSSHFDVDVRDTTAPVLQSHVDLVAEAAGPGGAHVAYTRPAAADSLDGSVAVACTPASGSLFAPGHTTVACTANDAAGNTSTSTFDVDVRDTTGPAVQAHPDAVAEATGPSGAAVAYALPTASDLVDGVVAASCAPPSGTAFAPGHTTVTCTASDAAGNASTSTFDVDVRDTTAPSISAHADDVAEATGASGAVVTYPAPAANDLVDGGVAVTCAPASGTVFALGHTTVTCSAHDAAGNDAAAVTFDVHVRDTTAPVLSAHADLVAEATGQTGSTVTYTAPAAADAVSGALAVTCAPASGTTFALGHTTVTCSTEDAAHNVSTSSFDVDVRDTTGPAIQAHADIVVEATGPSGASVAYTTPGATDEIGGAVTVTCAPASGANFTAGHTTVTCTAHDAANNSSSTTFDVHVRDTTSPAIQAHADVVVEATGAGGAAVAYTLPAATDLADPSVTVTCSPAPGATFALGHTTVTCSAQDAAGNQAATQNFDVEVRDTTGPVIQAHGNIVAEATGASGATITYALPTAADAVSGTATVTCAPVSGTTFALGHTTVTCSAQDAAHNVSSSSFDVHVRDTTAPAITVPTSFTVSASSSSGIVVTFAATATDAVDGTDTVTCTPSSGATFPVGHTTVTCTASDNAGNTATSRSFDVVVTTSQSLSDATQAGVDLVDALGTLGLAQSVYDGLTGLLYAAGNSLIQNGDAVSAWQTFNAFDDSARTQLTAAQYAQVSPLILDTRTILGW